MKTKVLILSLLTLAVPAFSNSISPEEGLKRLMSGNERYANDQLECPERLQVRRTAVTSKQTPFAVIVGCSDSRVPAEIVFDQGVGDIFVVRIAGNVIGSTESESIEYAIDHLHATLIMVLGHENCGAVDAVFTGNAKDIPAIASLIEPAIKGKPDLEKAVKANVQSIVTQLEQAAFLKPHLAEKKVKVVGAYYNLKSGKVTLLP